MTVLPPRFVNARRCTLTGALALLGLTAAGRPLLAQDPAALAAFQEGRRLALESQPDSAIAAYRRAAAAATQSGDRAMASAAARGLADVYLVHRACGDSALRLLRDAVAASAVGDRSAADALVRLLASRGDATGARSVLVKAYEDTPAVGRQITRESVTFLQGMAAVERAGGHESAALATLNSALQIAVRLHEGDEKDASDHAVGAVTAENVWVLYDLSQLRTSAKSPAIASARESARIMDQLVEAWPTVTTPGQNQFPVTRLGDRLVVQAATCAKAGSSCPVPKPAKCP